MLFEKVRDILAEQLEIDPETITLDTNIVDDLDADSLDFVEMITSIEDEFNIVVTGEGRLDEQTMMGKAPSGVAKIAKRHGKTVIAFSGSVTEDAAACNAKGIDAFFPILRRVVTLQDAMDHETAAHNMANTVEQVFRLIRACKT